MKLGCNDADNEEKTWKGGKAKDQMPRTLRERETLLQGYLLLTEDSICDGVRFLAVRGSPRDVLYLSALRVFFF